MDNDKLSPKQYLTLPTPHQRSTPLTIAFPFTTISTMATTSTAQQPITNFTTTNNLPASNTLPASPSPTLQANPTQADRSNQNPFPGILKRMLCQESETKYRTADGQHPLIGWSDDGKLLFIRNPQTLFCSMMADFFVTTNLSSFIRQLNHYNFTKVKMRDHSLSSRLKQDQMLVYEHPTFTRDVQGDLQRKPKGFTRVPKRRASDDQTEIEPKRRASVEQNFVTWDKHNEIAGDHKTIWEVLGRHDKIVSELQTQMIEMNAANELEVRGLQTKVIELERLVLSQQQQLDQQNNTELDEKPSPTKLRKTRSETGC